MSEELKGGEATPKKKPADGTAEKTVGEIIDDTTKAPDGGTKKPTEGEGDGSETVPLATFLEVKKDLKKALNDLKAKKDSGDSSTEEIAEDLEALAEKFDIDPKFVKELSKILEGKAEKKVGESIKPILEQNEKLSKKEKDEAIDKAFKKHYAAALETMPEYADIANADAIKALSLLPENRNKTFAQLIEETYGKAITGKRTIEPTKPGGGKDPEPIDFDRAKNDTEYFKEIMKDPVRKKEYNEHMLAPRNRRS